MNHAPTPNQADWMATLRVADPPPKRAGGRGHLAWPWPVLTLLAALAGSLGSMDAQPFYAQLDKPAWAPPGWLFGPVWTLLYVLMAVAAVQVARSDSTLRRAALASFVVQLAVNALWSWAFFGWRNGPLSLGVVAALLVVLVANAMFFGAVRRSAGWMLVPSVAWVAFAAALNFAVWQRNPGLLS